MSDPVRITTLAEIPHGGKLLAEVGGRWIALFNVDGSIFALDDVCTHDGGPLAEGVFQGTEIRCPRHGARFDVRSGKAIGFPAFEPVSSHRVEIRGDEVYVILND
ncbi:MAG: non-heme iron oxygenase ferredoxin subunit [Isosphaeraceae bacterium]